MIIVLQTNFGLFENGRFTQVLLYWPTHKIFVLNPYAQKPPLKAHADVSSETRGLKVVQADLYSELYYVYSTRKGSGETVHKGKLVPVFASCRCDK